MCTPPGPNLRNQVAHGLADANLYFSAYGIYVWWLILALVVEEFHKLHRADQLNRADGAEEP